MREDVQRTSALSWNHIFFSSHNDNCCVIVDDSNPLELAKFCLELDVDLFIGGVKERPIAYKLGIGFCDHNHERKEALAGFEGMVNFAREVHASVMSPVWKFTPRRSHV